MPWKTFNDFLEGEPLKVAAPKTQGSNYVLTSDAPVFGASSAPVEHPSRYAETAQMTTRIKYFLFRHFFDPATCPEIKPCARCCAEWLLAAQDRPPAAPGPPPAGLFELGRAGQVAARGQRRGGGAGSDGARWHIEKERGTYEYDDLPGRCFRCGEEGHVAQDCAGRDAASASSGQSPARRSQPPQAVPAACPGCRSPTLGDVGAQLCRLCGFRF